MLAQILSCDTHAGEFVSVLLMCAMFTKDGVWHSPILPAASDEDNEITSSDSHSINLLLQIILLVPNLYLVDPGLVGQPRLSPKTDRHRKGPVRRY